MLPHSDKPEHTNIQTFGFWVALEFLDPVQQALHDLIHPLTYMVRIIDKLQRTRQGRATCTSKLKQQKTTQNHQMVQHIQSL